MPKKKKGEGDNAYQERVSDWRANYQERMADWRDAKNRYETAQRDRARTVAQGKLDYKWKVRDDAAAVTTAARDAMKQAVNERIGRLSAGVGTGRAFASVTGFDLSSAASLQSEALWRGKRSTPPAPRGAESRAGERRRSRPESRRSCPTANNVKKWLIKKRDQMSKFAEMLGGLKKKGVLAVMLAQVAQMDPGVRTSSRRRACRYWLRLAESDPAEYRRCRRERGAHQRRRHTVRRRIRCSRRPQRAHRRVADVEGACSGGAEVGRARRHLHIHAAIPTAGRRGDRHRRLAVADHRPRHRLRTQRRPHRHGDLDRHHLPRPPRRRPVLGTRTVIRT